MFQILQKILQPEDVMLFRLCGVEASLHTGDALGMFGASRVITDNAQYPCDIRDRIRAYTSLVPLPSFSNPCVETDEGGGH